MFHVSPDLFYGSPGPESRFLETPRKVDPRIFLKQRRVQLLSPSRTFKVFERQDDALLFVKSRRGNNLMTFVTHADGTGHRMFLVTHPKEFWIHDVEKIQSKRCSYELIPEFTPCKLYVDLEFETKFNPDCDGPKMTELFIQLVTYRLFQLYHLKVDRSMILDLDSTSDKKFSRHLIYQIPMLCFASNYEIGLLILEICNWIRDGNEKVCSDLGITKDVLNLLIVKDRYGKDKLFCDECVYSKNRHFRLYGSTKPNKNSHLILSPQNQYTVPFTEPKQREEAIFLASLVTNFEPMDIIVPLPERGFANKLERTTILRTEYSSNRNNLPSPFPVLDKFALNEMEDEGIRCWVYFSSTMCLVYESYRPAFCGNIGRTHRSNKGMLVIDLKKQCYYRKCHDSDCSGYYSEQKQVPFYVVASLQHPECTEEQKKEIKELLEFLESQDCVLPLTDTDEMNCSQSSIGSGIVDLNLDVSQSSRDDVNMSQSSIFFQQDVNMSQTSISLPEEYNIEVNNILQFLESRSDIDTL